MPVMSLGIRSGVNWMRVKSSDSDCASECTISVFASPGTPFENAVAAGEDGHQQLLDDLVLADDLPGHLLADLIVGLAQLVQFGQIDAHRSCVVLKIASPPSSALENRKKLERKLQDDHGDGGAVNLADPVAVPRAVGCLHGEQLVAGGREVLVPVLVARHVETLGGVEVRVEGVAAPLVPSFVGAELVPDILQAVGGDGPSNWPAL